MKSIKVYENVKEVQKAIDKGVLKRGQYCYIFSACQKVNKTICLYRIVYCKHERDLVLV